MLMIKLKLILKRKKKESHESLIQKSKTLVIYRSNVMFMKSLKLQYESEIAKAKDNIEVYLSNPAGIGEHPDLAAAIDTQVEVIAHAEDKLGVIMKHFGHKI